MITTTSLSSGTVGVPYSQTLAATGGSGPYTWQLISGTLPAGLRLSQGVISGTPTEAVTSQFVLQVTDSGDPVQSVQAGFGLTIEGCAVLYCANVGWSQTESSIEEIIEQFLNTGALDGHADKIISRSGDAAAVTLSKILGRKSTLTATDITGSVTIIKLAFAAPNVIDHVPDREPRTALVVVHYLNSLTNDSQAKKRIADTRSYILERFNGTKGK